MISLLEITYFYENHPFVHFVKLAVSFTSFTLWYILRVHFYFLNCGKVYITENLPSSLFLNGQLCGIDPFAVVTTIQPQSSLRLTTTKKSFLYLRNDTFPFSPAMLIFIDVFVFAFQREKGKILLCFSTLSILTQDSSFIGLRMRKIFLKWLRLWLMVQMWTGLIQRKIKQHH